MRVADLKWWTIVKNSLVYIDEEINNKEKNTQLLPWDLVFSKVWTIDEVSILPNEFPVYNMSQNIIWVKIRNNNSIIPDYIRNIFQLSFWKQQLIANSMSGVQPKITLDSIKNIKIPLPPLEIQEEIVDKMDSALAEKKDLENKSEEILNSIDDYVLSELWIQLPKGHEEKKYFTIDFEDIKNWRFDVFYNKPEFKKVTTAINNGKYPVKRLVDLLEYYKKWTEVWSSEYIENWEIPFVRVSDIDNYWIHIENCDKFISKEKFIELQNYRPQKWEILFSKDWTIGFSCIVAEDENCIISWWILRLKTIDIVNPIFLRSILINRITKRSLDQKMIWAVIKHLDLDSFENLDIPFPPIEVQNEIANEIKSRIEKAKQLKNQAVEIYEQAKNEVEKMILE